VPAPRTIAINTNQALALCVSYLCNFSNHRNMRSKIVCPLKRSRHESEEFRNVARRTAMAIHKSHKSQGPMPPETGEKIGLQCLASERPGSSGGIHNGVSPGSITQAKELF
jgi:hypothetical protein